MKRLPFVLMFVLVCTLASYLRPAHGQGYSSRFSSSRFSSLARPTISPWLNLYRRDPGPLGGYLSEVRPRQELRGLLQQQELNMRRQATALQQQQTGILSLQRRVTGLERGGVMAPTGTGSVFMNYPHFYHFPTPFSRRR